MTARQRPGSSGEDEPADDTPDVTDAFAGLTGIDVVDGELIPRAKRRR